MQADYSFSKKLKVAIVHDWLIGGGAELVVLQLHQLFPDAPIYTSLCTDEWRQKLDNKVITSWLQYWPFSRLYKFLPVLRIWWFSRLKFKGYDLVISSSGNGEAKGIHVPKGTLHICYCHSPTHFYWRHYQEYLRHPKSGILNPLARLGLRLLVNPLRKWDYQAAQRPDYFIANSTHIQNDIKQYYGRNSVVINPPVDVERFQRTKTAQRYGFVTVGRQVPVKHTEIIVQACTQLNLPLTVVGRGPEHNKLMRLAGPRIKFIVNASDEDVTKEMASAEAFIFAAFDDFGITPVESLAAGTPVIAYKAGGALDYVKDGGNGLLFAEQTVESLKKALLTFQSNNFDANLVKKSAEPFSPEAFSQAIMDFIKQKIA